MKTIDLTKLARALAGTVRPWALPAGVALVALTASACNVNDLLKVKDPDTATPGSTNSEAALPVLLAGAIGEFHVAYQGTGNGNESSGQVGYSGLLSDEIRSSDTFPTRNEIDARRTQLTNSSNEAQFINLSRARAAADRAADRYASLAPDDGGKALAHALSGFATILFAENYCSGVPFSKVNDDGSLEYGDPETTDQMLQRALAQFDAAAGIAAVPASYTRLAAIGRGRALLNQGKYPEAAAAVAGVPTAFVYLSESSTNSSAENNGVWMFFQNVKRLTVPDKEGTNGLDFLSAKDPRVLYNDTTSAQSFDKTTKLVLQLKYPDRDSDVPVATGIEARLIEAEAAMQAGQLTVFRDKLNEARSAFAGLAALPVDSIPATRKAQEDLLFRERAFGLWLTSHRLGDLRRLVRQYGRSAESVFPSGTWEKDGTPYGTDVNLPVPQVETNNPKFTGCIDRKA